MISAYHISDTGPSTFCRLFIFHNDLMRGRLVSCPPTKMTRLRGARDCHGHIAASSAVGLWTQLPDYTLLPPCPGRGWDSILSLEGRSSVIWLTFASQFLVPAQRWPCPPLMRLCLLLQFPLEGRIGGTRGVLGCFGMGQLPEALSLELPNCGSNINIWLIFIYNIAKISPFLQLLDSQIYSRSFPVIFSQNILLFTFPRAHCNV